MSISETTLPRGFITIEFAAQLLTDGGTTWARAWAEEFLRIVVDSQGYIEGAHGVPGASLDYHWHQGGPIHVDMHQITPALRDQFEWWAGRHVPADERMSPKSTTSSPPAVLTPTYTARGKTDCSNHLVDLMKAGPPEPGINKTSLRQQLTVRFKISGRSFNEIWSRALENAGARATWGKPGRRPKSVTQT
jgi:hypothetical protein